MDARIARTGSWVSHHRLALWVVVVLLLFFILAVANTESAGGLP